MPPDLTDIIIEDAKDDLDFTEEMGSLKRRMEAFEKSAADDDRILTDYLSNSSFKRNARRLVLIIILFFETCLLVTFLHLLWTVDDVAKLSKIAPIPLAVLISGFFLSFVAISGFVLLGLFPRKNRDKKVEIPNATGPLINLINRD